MGKGFSRTFKFVVLGTIIGWVSPASGHSVRAAGEADLVISHARVITLDAGSHIAQAVAIRGDRLLAVGTAVSD